MEVTRIYVEGALTGHGMFIDTTDPIDLTKPFFTVTGVRNVPEDDWGYYDDGELLAVASLRREAIENPRKYVVSTKHIALIEYWERKQA